MRLRGTVKHDSIRLYALNIRVVGGDGGKHMRFE